MRSVVIAAGIIRRLLREKSTVGFMLVVPFLVSLLLVSLNPLSGPAVGVDNRDRGPEGTAVLARFAQASGAELRPRTEAKLRAAADAGEITFGVVIPADFSAAIRETGNPRVAVYLPRPSAATESLLDSLQGAIAARAAAGRGTAAGGVIPVQAGSRSEPAGDFRGRLALGFFLMVIMLYSATLVQSLLADRHNQTWARVYSAPVRAGEMVMGYLLALGGLGLLQITLSLGLATGVFRLPWGVAPLAVFLILAAFLVAALGGGIGLAGWAGDSERFGGISNLAVTPTCLLGGCFLPLELLPSAVRQAANLLPQKWAMEALAKLQAGTPLAGVTVHLLVLVLFGLVFSTFGVRALRPGAEDR